MDFTRDTLTERKDHGVIYKSQAELSAVLYEDIVREMIESGRYKAGKHIKGCVIEKHYSGGILVRKDTNMGSFRMFLSWPDLYLMEHDSIDAREVSFI